MSKHGEEDRSVAAGDADTCRTHADDRDSTAIRNADDTCRRWGEELSESSSEGSTHNRNMSSCIDQCSDRIAVNVNVKKVLVRGQREQRI